MCQTLVCISVSFSFFSSSVFSVDFHSRWLWQPFLFHLPWTLASCTISRGKFSGPQSQDILIWCTSSQYILIWNVVPCWGYHYCIPGVHACLLKDGEAVLNRSLHPQSCPPAPVVPSLSAEQQRAGIDTALHPHTGARAAFVDSRTSPLSRLAPKQAENWIVLLLV